MHARPDGYALCAVGPGLSRRAPAVHAGGQKVGAKPMLNREQLYLKQNIQVEPLIDHWYAWPHLIPPATAARNITERHMRIMNSFVSAPQIHLNAVKNPKMLGGPFIDLGPDRVDEIRALCDRIKTDRAHLSEL